MPKNVQTNISSVQFISDAQSCLTLCDPMNHSTPGLLVHHQLPEFTQTHVHRVGDAIQHLVLCCPLLLLSPIPPSIRVFSNELTFRMRWPKYWSFSFSIIPSKEIPGLISFRMDWLELLAVQGTYFCFIGYAKAFDYVDHNKLWKILKEMGIPDQLTCFLRNLYAGQEATVRTGHGTTDWFQIGKGVCQGCILLHW